MSLTNIDARPQEGTGTTGPTVTIVIPTLNEASNLRVVLPQLPEVDEIVLVDGGSKDGTVAVAQELKPEVKVVHQTRKGKGNALACGFRAATSDIIVMFDADGSADPKEIPAYIETLRSGADFAKGSRFIKGGGSEDITPLRRAGNAGLHLVFNRMFGRKFTDLCYGYNAFWTKLVPHLDLPPEHLDSPEGEMVWGDGFEIETLISCRMVDAGVDIREVPSVELPRIYGESNLRTFADGFRVLRTLLAERRRARRSADNVTALKAGSGDVTPGTEPGATAGQGHAESDSGAHAGGARTAAR